MQTNKMPTNLVVTAAATGAAITGDIVFAKSALSMFEYMGDVIFLSVVKRAAEVVSSSSLEKIPFVASITQGLTNTVNQNLNAVMVAEKVNLGYGELGAAITVGGFLVAMGSYKFDELVQFGSVAKEKVTHLFNPLIRKITENADPILESSKR